MKRVGFWALALVGLILFGCVEPYPPGPPPPPPPPYYQGPPPGTPPPDQPPAPPDQGYAPPAGPDQPPPGADQEAAPAPADQEQQDVGQFYDQLSPYGEWEQVPNYGWVWLPRGVAAGWRPYTEGHWVWSDAGWAWVSDEPFGWACYHYGRWYDDPGFGWAWVPGPVWAPAWVAWRSGGGFIGWAPLPPSIGWRAGFGLELGGVDLSVAIGASHFCFVGERDILSAHVGGVLVPFARNVTILRNTVNVTNYTVVNNRVVNRGVAVAEVERAVGHPIQAVHLASVSARGQAGVRGGTLSFYRPPVAAARGAVRPVGGVRPPPRPAPNYSAEELDRRHAAERSELENYQHAQQARLADIHQREMDAEKTQAGRDQLAREHEAEVHEQQQMHARQTQLMQSRQQRERERLPSRGGHH